MNSNTPIPARDRLALIDDFNRLVSQTTALLFVLDNSSDEAPVTDRIRNDCLWLAQDQLGRIKKCVERFEAMA